MALVAPHCEIEGSCQVPESGKQHSSMLPARPFYCEPVALRRSAHVVDESAQGCCDGRHLKPPGEQLAIGLQHDLCLIHPCSLLIRNIGPFRLVAIEFLSQRFYTHDQEGIGKVEVIAYSVGCGYVRSDCLDHSKVVGARQVNQLIRKLFECQQFGFSNSD